MSSHYILGLGGDGVGRQMTVPPPYMYVHYIRMIAYLLNGFVVSICLHCVVIKLVEYDVVTINDETTTMSLYVKSITRTVTVGVLLHLPCG